MQKKIQTNYYDVSEACHDLDAVGKTSICNGGFDDESGKTCVSLLIYQKNKNASNLQKDVRFAKNSLEELGFKKVFGDGMDGIIAIADVVIEYDIRKKPYTITKANLQEMKSLQEVIDYTGTKGRITRDEPKIEKVSRAEFKQAIANYIKQNQK